MAIATVRLGSKASTSGLLKLGEYPDGQEILCPTITVRGRLDGPQLWVQACVHGPEVGGIAGIHDVLRRLDPDCLRGTIVFVLLANPLGYRDNVRLNAVDGINFNRTFPGNAAGTTSERMAARLMEAATEGADAVVDLHSGGNTVVSAQYAIYSHDGTQAGERSERLAAAAGFDVIWNAPSSALRGAAYLAYQDAGIPAVIVESGGGGQVTASDIENFANAIFGICAELGMSEPRPDRHPRQISGLPSVVRPGHGGLLLPRVCAGESVIEKQLVASVLALDGTVKEDLLAPKSGFISSITKNYHQVYSGEEIATVV